MKLLTILFLIEAGFIPNGQIWNHDIDNAPTVIEEQQVTTDVGARFMVYEHFFFGGSVETVSAVRKDSWTFDPFIGAYDFEAGVTFGGIELGWRHECTHPVAANWSPSEYLGMESAHDEIYVRVEAEATLIE